jgi:hypothetical protein
MTQNRGENIGDDERAMDSLVMAVSVMTVSVMRW